MSTALEVSLAHLGAVYRPDSTSDLASQLLENPWKPELLGKTLTFWGQLLLKYFSFQKAVPLSVHKNKQSEPQLGHLQEALGETEL